MAMSTSFVSGRQAPRICTCWLTFSIDRSAVGGDSEWTATDLPATT
ncbi:hypothetical protein ACFQ0B_14285 [Nonomuraea thailandensis]